MQPTFHDTFSRQIGDEHAVLHDRLLAVQHALRERRLGRDAAAWTFAELARQVLDHFAHEEFGGYFAEALAAAPHWSERAAALLAEHAEMAAELESIREQAGRPLAAHSDWQTLEIRYSQFVARFQAHERAENELLQAAYCQDLGSAD